MSVYVVRSFSKAKIENSLNSIPFQYEAGRECLGKTSCFEIIELRNAGINCPCHVKKNCGMTWGQRDRLSFLLSFHPKNLQNKWQGKNINAQLANWQQKRGLKEDNFS